METATIHPFEQAGLGMAPFRFLSLTQSIYVSAPGEPELPGTTCDYCGTAIKNVCNIESHDRRRAKVGCDCIRKLDRADNRLINEMERAEAQHHAKIRAEKREAARAARCEAERPAREAKIRAYEEAKAIRDAELAAIAARETANNEWLIDCLRRQYQGDFILSMIDALSRGPLNGLSNRCIGILRDIYAKDAGRRGSRAYNDAAADFDGRLDSAS